MVNLIWPTAPSDPFEATSNKTVMRFSSLRRSGEFQNLILNFNQTDQIGVAQTFEEDAKQCLVMPLAKHPYPQIKALVAWSFTERRSAKVKQSKSLTARQSKLSVIQATYLYRRPEGIQFNLIFHRLKRLKGMSLAPKVCED